MTRDVDSVGGWRINLLCDHDGCRRPAFLVTKGPGIVECRAHALGVLDSNVEQ